MSVTDAQILAAAEGLEEVLAKLSEADREKVMGGLRKAITPAVWYQEYGLDIARANVKSIKIGNAVRALQDLVGSKLDMSAMMAINDTTMSDEQRVTTLIQALYGLLAEHQLIMAAANQILSQATDFQTKSSDAANAVLAFGKLTKD